MKAAVDISAITRHAHASPLECAEVMVDLLDYFRAHDHTLIGDGARIKVITVTPGLQTVEVAIDGEAHMMSALTLAGYLGPDGSAIFGRWCQLLIAGTKPADLVTSYPDWIEY